MSSTAIRSQSLRSLTPPSGLPAISPSRGEIDSFDHSALPLTSAIGEGIHESAISPLEREMAGRPEGGVEASRVDPTISDLAVAVLDACRARGIMLATAASCTGGMIAAALTDIAGSSDVVDRGFVTYSNEAKMEMIGVAGGTLEAFGAVSRETALEMATGALTRSRAGIALSVTGIAGPGGGSPEKPVGLVWFGLAMAGREPFADRRLFEDRGRAFIRRETVRTALEMALAALGPQPGAP